MCHKLQDVETLLDVVLHVNSTYLHVDCRTSAVSMELEDRESHPAELTCFVVVHALSETTRVYASTRASPFEYDSDEDVSLCGMTNSYTFCGQPQPPLYSEHQSFPR